LRARCARLFPVPHSRGTSSEAPARHPEPQGAVLSALRQRPPRGEAVRSYTTAPLPGQSPGAGSHERAAAHQVHGGERNGPPGRSSSHTSSAAQRNATQRNAGMCRLYPMHRAHRIAWRGV